MQSENKDIEMYMDEYNKRVKNPIISIIVLVSVIVILGGITILTFNLIEQYTEVDVPWIEIKETKKDAQKATSTKKMKLQVPELSDQPTIDKIFNSEIAITKIVLDKSGYTITISLKCLEDEFVNVSIKQVNLDGYYFAVNSTISDSVDYDENGLKLPSPDQKETLNEIKISKTELDKLEMIGFNNIKLIYDAESNKDQQKNNDYYVTVKNKIKIVNEKKGLSTIDEKEKVKISYHKKVKTEDGIYIYFDFYNQNMGKDIQVFVKQLIINDKLFDMSDFQEISNRDAHKTIYLFIPKNKIKKINSFKIQFILLDENETTKEKSFYITKEYSKEY